MSAAADGRRGRGIPHGARLPVDPDLDPDDPAAPSTDHRPAPHVRRGADRPLLAVVGAGGFVGTLARYEVGRAWPAASGHLPWATLTINTSGALLLGLVLTLLLETLGRTRFLQPFACVGVLGGWTTMSTFAVETDLLVRDGRVAIAAAYVGATVVLGIAACGLGVAVARALSRRGAP